jgi:hypothetical protein
MISPKAGVNLRLHPHDISVNQWALMTNVDMNKGYAHDEHFKSIDGSVKYHGVTIGTQAPTCIPIYYDNSLDKSDVLACVDDKILRKNKGTNEFETIYSSLEPNKITSYVNVMNRMILAHPTQGLFEYDGYTVRYVEGSPKLSSIVFVKEINRAFGISAENPDSYLFTDDVSTTGGVPVNWNPLNVDVVPSDEGDVEESLFVLNGRLVHLRTNGIWIYYIGGAPSQWRPEKKPTDAGCLAPKTAKMVNNEIWFLGHSPKLGRALFAFDGVNSRVLSYDIESYMYRINPYRIKNACAEYVGNQYKLSVSLDSDRENNTTFHFDTMYANTETNMPCVYGPHTYGFESSAVLNTRQFGGEHLFGRKGWVYKVDEVYTQYGSPQANDGELIPVKLVTPIYEEETTPEGKLGPDWYKRYEKFLLFYPPKGTWNATVNVYKDYEANPSITFKEGFKGENDSIEELILGSSPIDRAEQSYRLRTFSELGRSIQFEFINENVNEPLEISGFQYDSRPVRRIKNAQKIN